MKKIIKPPALKESDRVAVIAPAGLVDREVIEPAIEKLESWGLEVERGDALYERFGVFAGADARRLADLQKALDDPGIRAIICARGGYGMSRIIRSVDFRAFRKNPKWVAGFSDISVLHLFINCNLGISTLHAEMPLNFHKNEENSATLVTLKKSLFEGPQDYDWSTGPKRDGTAEGILTGGNLSLISNLLGTEIKEYLKGKILFIEENGEYFYSLDRMITGLRLAGVFEKIKGLIIGGLSNIKESEVRYSSGADDIIMESVSEYAFPVAFGFPAGHIKDNRALVLGAGINLEVSGGKAVLRYL
ncbi:MAG: LD-carboxypeptidase [Bacteroidota bacterium]|nr:LD-carboxypeptidase [Bacteroidota bacterium]